MQLDAAGLPPSHPLLTALGVREVRGYLAGLLSREDALEFAQADTRRYAKRQLTWFRRNMVAWRAINAQEMETSAADFVSFIQSAH
jgi:tRNA dimethylallyltransferase